MAGEVEKAIEKLFDLFSDKENFKEMTQLLREKIGLTAKERKADWLERLISRGYTFVVVATCFVAILYAASTGIIDKCTAGTLLGTILGYTLNDLKRGQDYDN